MIKPHELPFNPFQSESIKQFIIDNRIDDSHLQNFLKQRGIFTNKANEDLIDYVSRLIFSYHDCVELIKRAKYIKENQHEQR